MPTPCASTIPVSLNIYVSGNRHTLLLSIFSSDFLARGFMSTTILSRSIPILSFGLSFLVATLLCYVGNLVIDVYSSTAVDTHVRRGESGQSRGECRKAPQLYILSCISAVHDSRDPCHCPASPSGIQPSRHQHIAAQSLSLSHSLTYISYDR